MIIHYQPYQTKFSSKNLISLHILFHNILCECFSELCSCMLLADPKVGWFTCDTIPGFGKFLLNCAGISYTSLFFTLNIAMCQCTILKWEKNLCKKVYRVMDFLFLKFFNHPYRMWQQVSLHWPFISWFVWHSLQWLWCTMDWFY